VSQQRRRAERALRELVTEVRADAAPEPDWARLEARLPQTPVPAAPRRGGVSRVLLAAAAVALVAAGFAWQKSAEAPPVAALLPRQAPLTSATDGNQLAPGTTIAAQAEARTIDHPRLASWTLAPHSSATLVTRGDRVVVRLEAGSLTARIVPSTRPETFAVEAADVRVAAHGTVFSVTLHATAVAVSVEEGVVLVGPRSTPGIGKRLQGPSAERFTLLGAPEVAPVSPEPNRRTPRTGPPHVETPPAGVASAAASAASPVEEPSLERKREALEQVVALASACFSERTSASDGVRVTAHSALTLQTSPEGTVRSVRFDPPLAPNVQTCIDAGVTKLSVVTSPQGFQNSRVVVLER
jgi:ferric-dicitrate binding protein FerR (iron transport regulator)